MAVHGVRSGEEGFDSDEFMEALEDRTLERIDSEASREAAVEARGRT